MLDIIKGSEQYINECTEMLIHSELGRQYFSREGSALHAVREAAESDTFYVAKRQDACVGFMYYLPHGAFHAFPYLHLIVVGETERGHGTGTEMLRYLEKLVAAGKLFLAVAEFNPEGKHFYEKNGYVQVGKIDSLYRAGVTEYLMMKELKQG